VAAMRGLAWYVWAFVVGYALARRFRGSV
jgi:hypothetical protein